MDYEQKYELQRALIEEAEKHCDKVRDTALEAIVGAMDQQVDRVRDKAKAVAEERIANQQQAVDPWAHRSKGMRCRTCMWFAPKAGTLKGLGRCRRHAPTIMGYPAVFEHDWCGDHKLDENAVQAKE